MSKKIEGVNPKFSLFLAPIFAFSVAIYSCGDNNQQKEGPVSAQSDTEAESVPQSQSPEVKPKTPVVSTPVEASKTRQVSNVQAAPMVIARIKTSDLNLSSGVVEFSAVNGNTKIKSGIDAMRAFENGEKLSVTQSIGGLVASSSTRTIGLALTPIDKENPKQLQNAFGYPSIGCIGCGLGNYSAGVGVLAGVVKLIGGLLGGSITSMSSFLSMLNPFAWINGNPVSYSNTGNVQSGLYQYFQYLLPSQT